LAKQFQRRILKCEKLMNPERQVMAKAHFAFGNVNYKDINFLSFLERIRTIIGVYLL
jgi:hypothetical protein